MIYMSSNSTSNGSAVITVTFDVGYDLNIASVDVQNRVQTAEAQLPSETQQAGISVVKQSSDITLIVSLKAPEGGYDNTYLGNYAQINLMDPLTRGDGGGSITIPEDVAVSGADPYAIVGVWHMLKWEGAWVFTGG